MQQALEKRTLPAYADILPPAEQNWIIPFGPVIAKFTISENVRDILWKNALETRNSDEQKQKELNYANMLAGNIQHQYRYDLPDLEYTIVSKELETFAHKYAQILMHTGRWAPENPEIEPSSEFDFSMGTLWHNWQQAAEWNPLHLHEGEFSMALFLKIPKEIEQERFQPHQQNNHPSAGKLAFLFGEPVPYCGIMQDVVPREGVAYFFPSKLRHLVYPFKSDVTRVSVSTNFFFKENTPPEWESKIRV